MNKIFHEEIIQNIKERKYLILLYTLIFGIISIAIIKSVGSVIKSDLALKLIDIVAVSFMDIELLLTVFLTLYIDILTPLC